MPANHDRRLLELLYLNQTLEEALIVIAYEMGINLGPGKWSLLTLKRMEFMRPIVRRFDEYADRSWTEPLVVPD